MIKIKHFRASEFANVHKAHFSLSSFRIFFYTFSLDRKKKVPVEKWKISWIFFVIYPYLWQKFQVQWSNSLSQKWIFWWRSWDLLTNSHPKLQLHNQAKVPQVFNSQINKITSHTFVERQAPEQGCWVLGVLWSYLSPWIGLFLAVHSIWLSFLEILSVSNALPVDKNKNY